MKMSISAAITALIKEGADKTTPSDTKWLDENALGHLFAEGFTVQIGPSNKDAPGSARTLIDRSKKTIKLEVPAGDGMDKLALRFHEYGHITIALHNQWMMPPPEPKANAIYQTLCDIYVNSMLAGVGLQPVVKHLSVWAPGIPAMEKKISLEARAPASNPILMFLRAMSVDDHETMALAKECIDPKWIPALEGLYRAAAFDAQDTVISKASYTSMFHFLQKIIEGTFPETPSMPGPGKGEGEGDGEGEKDEDTVEGMDTKTPEKPTKPRASKHSAFKDGAFEVDGIPPAAKKLYDKALESIKIPKGSYKYIPRTDFFEPGTDIKEMKLPPITPEMMDRSRKVGFSFPGRYIHLTYAGEDKGQMVIPYISGDADWGTMEIIETRLTSRYSEMGVEGGSNRKKVRHLDIGYMKHPERVMTDARLFALKQRGVTATVLIDASGSMGLSAGDIHTMVDMLPAVTVACYGGNSSGGKMAILARRGKAADLNEYRRIRLAIGGANIVDVPALQWLCTQSGPRIWVSDGAVTGLYDSGSRKVSDACLKAIRSGMIIQCISVAGVKQLVDKLFLRKKARKSSVFSS